MKKKLLLILIAAVAVLSSACGKASSEINEIGLVYTGGATEDKKFEKILPAGSTWNSIGVGSTVYRYRIDQRSFIAAPEGKTRDISPVQFVSKDDVRMLVEFQMYFKLNQDEDTIVKFHENLGVKTKAWEEDGWTKMLNEYFAPQIERALEAVGLKHNWRDLYASEEARVAFQAEVVQRVKENLREVVGVGADYFCGPSYDPDSKEKDCDDFTFTVGKPEPVNGKIIEAIESEQTAAAATAAQAQENARIAAQIEGERRIVDMYGPDGAIERERNQIMREAVASGKVGNFIIDNSGRSTVQAR